MASLVILIPFAWVGQTQAAEFALTEEDFFAPMPMVLSASRLVQPLSEAPVAMTVIDRQTIEASSAISIPELLRLVPGFQVTYTEGIDAIATYHGFADGFPRRLQVLVDGRSVYDPGLNGVVWSALPLTLDQIERIEVVRGPNAAAFGSNAFLGTINIVSRSPEASDSLVVRTLGGDDLFEGEIGHAAQVDGFAYRLNASYSNSGGFEEKPDDSKSRILNFQAIYRPTLVDSLTVSTGLRETDFDSVAFRIPREREYRSHYQQLIWSHLFSADQDIRLQFFHNALESPDDISFLDADSGLPLNVDYSLSTHRYDLELQHRFSPADDWRVSWGGGLRWDRAEGGGIFDSGGNLRRDQARIFANLEWRAHPDMVINLGLMGEDFSDLGSYFSPRLAANWHVLDHHTLRFSAARAYRMPTFFERRGDLKLDVLLTPNSPDWSALLGTADNAAEKVHSFELGYLFEASGLNGTFDLRLFHNEVDPILRDAKDDSLDNPIFGSPRRFIEAGVLRVSGVEAQAQLRPFDGSLIHLAYAYAYAGGSRIVVTDANGNPTLPRDKSLESNEDPVPEHTLTALVSQELTDDWRLSGTFSYVSTMEWLSEGDIVDGHSRIDAKLAKRFRQQDGDIELSVNVQNLLDDPYWEFSSTDTDAGVIGNLSERRVYAQIKFILR